MLLNTTTTTTTIKSTATKKKSPPKSMMIANQQSQEWVNKLNEQSSKDTEPTEEIPKKKKKLIIKPKSKSTEEKPKKKRKLIIKKKTPEPTTVATTAPEPTTVATDPEVHTTTPTELYNIDHQDTIGYDKKTKTYYKKKDSIYKTNHLIYDKSNEYNIPLAKNTNPKYPRSYNYLTVPLAELREVIGLETDEGYLELLGDGYRKLYFDLDIKNGKEEDYVASRTKLFNILNYEGIDTSNFTEYGGERIKNDSPYVSYHIILNNNTFFLSAEHIKNYSKYLFAKYPELGELIDKSVYSKYQLFRMPYQAKEYNKESILKFKGEKPDITEYLVGRYGDLSKEVLSYPEHLEMDVKYMYEHNEDQTELIKITKKLTNKDKKNIKLNHSYYRACEGVELKLGLNDGSIEYLVKSIPNNPDVPYSVFADVGMALRRTCVDMKEPQSKGLTLWTNWTKQYDTDITEDDLSTLYHSYSKTEKGKATLLRYARMFNKDFDKTDKSLMIENYFNNPPQDDRYNIIDVDTNKLGEAIKIKELVENHKLIILKAPMGTGKSYCLQEELFADEQLKVVYASCKRSFAMAMVGELERFNFKNYLDKEVDFDMTDCVKAIISLESMKRATGTTDVLILDEIETILSNVSSEMLKNHTPEENLTQLISLIKNAKSVIFMDAFVSKRTTMFIDDLISGGIIPDTKVQFINNIYKSPERTVKRCLPIKEGKQLVQTAKHSFFGDIITSVRDKKLKVAVCLGSKTDVDSLYNRFKEINEANENDPDTPQIRIRCYTSSNPLPPCDVNKEWRDIDLLIYSPTITAGISCSKLPEDKQFDKLYLSIGSVSNPLARDIIQSSKRVRFFRDSEIILLIKDANFEGEKPQTRDKIIELDNIYNQELGLSERTITTNPNLLPFKNVMINNLLERNLNDKNLNTMMNYFFVQENITNAGTLLPVLADLTPEVADITYSEIEDIDEEDFEKLSIRYNSTDHNKEYLSETEHQQRAKYDYKHNITKANLTEEKIEEFWNENVNGMYGDDVCMYNTATFMKDCFLKKIKPFIPAVMLEELDIDEDTVVNRAITSYNKYAEFSNRKRFRKQLILYIMKKLGIYTEAEEGYDQDALEFDKEFTSLQLLELKPLLDTLSPNTINLLLDTTHSVRMKKPNPEVGYTLININSIVSMLMKTHFDITVMKQGRKQVRIDGKKKDIYRYKLARHYCDKITNPQREVGFNVFRFTYKEFSE